MIRRDPSCPDRRALLYRSTHAFIYRIPATVQVLSLSMNFRKQTFSECVIRTLGVWVPKKTKMEERVSLWRSCQREAAESNKVLVPDDDRFEMPMDSKNENMGNRTFDTFITPTFFFGHLVRLLIFYERAQIMDAVLITVK
jgi:hypothetical protein